MVIALSSKVRLTGSEVKLGKALFDQQLWCFGRDIHASGNLLLAYGMERLRPPRCVPGKSQYFLRRDDQSAVVLWGFGALIQVQGMGAMLLRRYTFFPRYRAEITLPYLAWSADALPPFDAPRTEDVRRHTYWLLRELIDWLQEYEVWLLNKAGLAHRAACLHDWHRKPACRPQEIPQAWARLSAALDALCLLDGAPCK